MTDTAKGPGFALVMEPKGPGFGGFSLSQLDKLTQLFADSAIALDALQTAAKQSSDGELKAAAGHYADLAGNFRGIAAVYKEAAQQAREFESGRQALEEFLRQCRSQMAPMTRTA